MRTPVEIIQTGILWDRSAEDIVQQLHAEGWHLVTSPVASIYEVEHGAFHRLKLRGYADEAILTSDQLLSERQLAEASSVKLMLDNCWVHLRVHYGKALVRWLAGEG